MYIKSLHINNFRNYTNESVNFYKDINLITGLNAIGKTNIIEAVYILSNYKSFRGSKESEWIKIGEDNMSVECVVKRKFGDINIKITTNRNNEKKIYINRTEEKKIGSILGTFVTVLFSPDELDIAKGAPEKRREFLDTDISQISKVYYELTNRYSKILNQRNKLLKGKSKNIKETLNIWDEQFADIACRIIKTRKGFLKTITPYAKEALKFLTNNKEELSIEYIGINEENLLDIKNRLLTELKTSFEKDRELGYTTVGPHRDDIKFEINGKDIRYFGSQGQKRTFILALKIAEIEVFKNEIKEEPILLLDDVFSELDNTRRKKLLQRLKGVQTIITATNLKNKTKETFLNIKIKDGRIYTYLKENNKSK